MSFRLDPNLIPSDAVIVCNKPNSISLVGSVDTCSWKYIREYFVPFSFQVSLHLVEDQPSIPINKSENVFENAPFRLNCANCLNAVGPQMAVIFCAEPFTGLTVWLAWLSREPAHNDSCSGRVPAVVDFLIV